jgi:hypothetical protein
MKRHWMMATLVAASGPIIAANAASAQTGVPAPYYASPSWDQKLACTTPANCPRFVVLSNWNSEAVLDRETGLVWERFPSGTRFRWFNGSSLRAEAHEHCLTLGKGGRLGWRLPTLPELLSLDDLSTLGTPGLKLPPGHPFQNIQADTYWTATRDVAFVGGDVTSFGAYYTTFDAENAFTASTHNTSDPLYVWCVRGAQAADQP